jgi:MFS family permease
VGHYLSINTTSGTSLYMSAYVITAQLIMNSMAKFAGCFADLWGRKPIHLIGFAGLPIRNFLCTFHDSVYRLVAVQTLDGIDTAVFGVIWVITVADLAKGTRRYNMTLAAIVTATALGTASNNLATGFVFEATSYDGGFLFLAVCALVGLVEFYFGGPETMNSGAKKAHERGQSQARVPLRPINSANKSVCSNGKYRPRHRSQAFKPRVDCSRINRTPASITARSYRSFNGQSDLTSIAITCPPKKTTRICTVKRH